MVCVSNHSRPDAALIATADEDEEPQSRSDKAEDRYKHHPAQRVGRFHSSRRHEDPNQTSDDLPSQTEQSGRGTDEHGALEGLD